MYLIKWIIDILMQKWDTIRFIDFYLAMQLANKFKILVDKSPLVEFYVEQQTKKVKWNL